MKVLIVGGTTFVGRNFVHYSIETNPSIQIVVIDRALIETSYMSPMHLNSFKKVEFIQGNLMSNDFLDKVFSKHTVFDVVYNFCTETRYGQASQVYKDKIFNTSINIAKKSKTHCSLFIHLSSASVYSVTNNPATEQDPLESHSEMSEVTKYLIHTENELKNLDLNLVILRPSLAYGSCDYYLLTPIFVMAKVYQSLDEQMKTLSSKSMKINTVHVLDICKALNVCTTNFLRSERATKTYNLSDKGDTQNQQLYKIIKEIFDIKVGTLNTLLSKFVKSHVENCIDDINNKHLEPWMQLLAKNNINSTPLSPFLDKEHLQYNSVYIDGSLIEKELGFTYDYPQINKDLIVEIFEEFEQMGIWPTKGFK